MSAGLRCVKLDLPMKESAARHKKLLAHAVVCRVLRPLAAESSGLCAGAIARASGVTRGQVSSLLIQLRREEIVRYVPESRCWKITRSKRLRAEIWEALFTYELAQLRKRKIRVDAAARLRMIDELAEAVFHARESVRR